MHDLPQLLAQGAATTESSSRLWNIFTQSFDTFSVLLILGSLVAGTVIVRCALEVRKVNIMSDDSERNLKRLAQAGKVDELRGFAERDGSFPARVLVAAMKTPARESAAIREAAELAAGEEVAAWFRKIEPLNVVGNLGPLLGLAGTVWGMVKAFMALNEVGGQATAASLSEGISKALFHTLLGLMLAIPSLAAFGFYRMRVDQLCTRAMVVSGELVDQYINLLHAPREHAAPRHPGTAPTAVARAS